MHSRLKDEYIDTPGREIGRLRKAGVEVTISEEEPLICFMGDTTDVVFSDYPEILSQHKVVVVECSFIDEKSLPRAEETRHMHWNKLKPHIESNPDTLFVLTHFSLKYSTLSLRTFFREQQSIYGNVHPMLLEDEVAEQWKKNGETGTSPPGCNCHFCIDNPLL